MALTMREIANYSGTSYATVRRLKIKLGRMPTIEEVIKRKSRVGRPSLVDNEEMRRNTVKITLGDLVEKYGEDATLKEIIENERNN